MVPHDRMPGGIAARWMPERRPGMTGMEMDSAVTAVTDRIIERSRPLRAAYLSLIERERDNGIRRPNLGCANLAHAYAGTDEDRDAMKADRGMNIGIVTAYNDMLSAHAVYYRYPELMKIWAREVGATAQVAGGVPAMCDGVTQGYPGMELVAVQPRHDRAVDRDRAEPRHVRGRGAARHLR